MNQITYDDRGYAVLPEVEAARSRLNVEKDPDDPYWNTQYQSDADLVQRYDLARAGFGPRDDFYYRVNQTAAGLAQSVDPNVLGYTSSDAGITALPQAQEQAQVVDDLSTSINPLDRFQSHVDFNEELRNKVGSGELSREDYNIMGGYDVAQKVLGPNFVATNPMFTGLGMAGASGIYNAIQALKGEQNWSEIPGTVLRNVQGSMGIISPKMRNQYNQFLQKTQQISPTVAQNISETISNYNPIQQQRYMQFASENPERAQAAAQQAQEFAMARKR